MPEATLTNAITNGLHASFLLAYFVSAYRADFPRVVIGLFLLLFLLKMMGVYVHYAPESPAAITMWAIIAVSTVAMNFLVLREAGVPQQRSLRVIAISVAGTAIFLTGVRDFSFIALPTALVFGVAAAHAAAGSRLRLGLGMVAASNLIWFVMRKIGQGLVDGELPVAYRYDNDLYHFLLIASTFMIYRGFKQRVPCNR